MFSTLCSALNAKSVPAVLLALGVGVASVPRDHVDPEALEAEARRPIPSLPPEARRFRFPAAGGYHYPDRPWIRSRADLVAHLTRGEALDVVRRYSAGPEEELVEYLTEASLRVLARYPGGLPFTPPAPPRR